MAELRKSSQAMGRDECFCNHQSAGLKSRRAQTQRPLKRADTVASRFSGRRMAWRQASACGVGAARPTCCKTFRHTPGNVNTLGCSCVICAPVGAPGSATDANIDL